MATLTRYWRISDGTKVYGAIDSGVKDFPIPAAREEWNIPEGVPLTAVEVCGGCIDAGEPAESAGCPETRYGGLNLCADCLDGYREQEDERGQEEDYYHDYHEGPYYGGYSDFADPGGNSALRAATDSNPRNLPCPNCGAPDRLTPADRARGYQCDRCADRCERGVDY